MDKLVEQRIEFFRLQSVLYRVLRRMWEERLLADAERYHDEAFEALGAGNQARHRYLAYWGDKTSRAAI